MNKTVVLILAAILIFGILYFGTTKYNTTNVTIDSATAGPELPTNIPDSLTVPVDSLVDETQDTTDLQSP